MINYLQWKARLTETRRAFLRQPLQHAQDQGSGTVGKPLRRSLLISLATAILAACGGGGSGGTSTLPPTGPTPSATSTPTSAPMAYSLTGFVKALPATCDGTTANCAPTGAASGFSVTLGAIPATGQGGAPVAPTYTATTDSNGNFTLANVPAGPYEIAISNGSAYAALHAKVTVPTASSLSYGVSALASGEQAWFSAINSYRSGGGAAAIVADEYAMEAGRAYAEYLVANTSTVCNPGCVNYAQFGQQYTSDGGLFHYGDSYRVALPESDCASFAEQDQNQGPFLMQKSAVYGGYGFRLGPGSVQGGNGVCAFAMVIN